METPKISIIIPVYDVEPYLRKCLDSVVGQTYRNLEIILVDDGSPDNCGAICDEYAARDGRVRVIHKANAGRAAARNTGLAAATGEWIGWVDGDDWIEPDMYEYLITNALESGADIAVCGWIYEDLNGGTKTFCRKERLLLDAEQAVEQLLLGELITVFWDKLCRRERYRGIRFLEGKEFEDTRVMWKILSGAACVACFPEAKYHYLRRPGTITGEPSLVHEIEGVQVYRQQLEEISERWPRFRPLLEAQCARSTVVVWGTYYMAPKAERRACLPELQELAAYSRANYHDIMTSRRLRLAGRLIYPLTRYVKRWAFALAWAAWRLRQSRIGQTLQERNRYG